MTNLVESKTCRKCGHCFPLTTEYFLWVSEYETQRKTKTGTKPKLIKAHFYPYCHSCERARGQKRGEAKRRGQGIEPRKGYPVVNGCKTCSKCGENKPLDLFPWRTARQQYHTQCRACRTAAVIAGRRAKGVNPRKLYPVVDGFKLCSDCGKRLPATEEYFWPKDKKGRLYAQCKECSQQGRADYRKEYQSQPGYYEYQKNWRYEHPDKNREYGQRWMSNPENYEGVLLKNHRTRAKKREVTVGEVPKNLITLLRGAQKDRCHWCKASIRRAKVHLDHFYPLNPLAGQRQGTHSVDNLVLACQHCNETKSNLQPEAFAQRAGYELRDPPFSGVQDPPNSK